MNPNLLEQFLGPSTDFFRFNTNDINILVTPIEKKTSMLTKRNLITTTSSASSAALAVLNNSSVNYSNKTAAVADANTRLSSSSTSKLSLKDKYKHIKSTIPPARPTYSKNVKNQLRSKSNNNIKDIIIKNDCREFLSSSVCNRTFSAEDLNESVAVETENESQMESSIYIADENESRCK